MIQKRDCNRVSFSIGVSWKPWQERKEVFIYFYFYDNRHSSLSFPDSAAQGTDEAALTIRFEKQAMF